MSTVQISTDQVLFCDRCNEQITGKYEVLSVNPYSSTDETWCWDCFDNQDSDDRDLSDYYGGGGPATMEEQYAKAAEEKRRG